MKKLHQTIPLLATRTIAGVSSVLLMLATLMSFSARAQYVVNFESESKSAYASANITLSGKSWNMDDALIGNIAGDKRNGGWSCRVRNTGSLTMLVDMPNGINTVSVYHGGYSGESGNWVLEASTDAGASWGAFASASQFASGALVQVTFTLNLPGTARIRLRKTSGGSNRINFDDITISDYVPLNTPPVIVLPSFSSIQPTVARLGANVTGSGNSAITGRGIVWSTTANPAIGQPGVSQVNVPDSTGAFDTLVTGLPAGTLIHFRGFAINANGTSYTADASFYTLSALPSGPVTNLTATGISNHDMRLDWTAVPGANGYVVLQKMYTPPTSFPVNSTQYIEGTTIGDADVVDTILSGSVQTATYTGLVSGTVYQYAVIPYGFNGANIETYDYYTQPVIPIAFDTTLGVGPSAASDLVGFQNSEALTISSVINDTLNTDTDGVQVWKLALRDGGSSLSDADDMPTIVSKMVITKGQANSVSNWQNTLQYAALFDDSTTLKVADAVIYADSITFNSIALIASDNNQKTYTLRISLKRSNIKDNDTLQFAINRSHIVTPSLNLSSQIISLNILSDSSRNKITVTATKFVITQQPPATARVNNILTPAFKLEVQDANGNKDLDHNAPVFLYSSKATLINAPVFKIAVNGEITFDSISFSDIAQGTILKVKTMNLDTAYSNPINVYASTQSDIIATNGFVYTDSIPYVYYQEANSLDSSNSVALFALTLRDGGATANDGDAFPTVLSNIGFLVQGYEYVRRVALYQGNTKLTEVAVTGSSLNIDNLHIVAADNDSTHFTLRASFNSRYADGQRIAFTVQQAFADTASGSLFAFFNAGRAASSVLGGNNVLKYTPVFVTAPVAVNAAICKGSSTSLTAAKGAGSILRWYTSPTGQTAFYTGDTLQLNQPGTSVSYFAEADSSGWASARVEIKATVITVATPSVSPVTVCRNNPATLQAAPGTSISWYRSFASTNALYTGLAFTTDTISHDTLFYVQADSATCKSEKVAVHVSIQPVSVPVISNTTICRNTSVALSTANANSAATNWYTQMNTSAPLFTGTTFTSGNIQNDTIFYVEADSNGCKSERLPVHVSIQQVNDPLIAEDSITICSGSNITFIASNTETIRWYTIPSGGFPFFSGDSLETPVLTTNATYYAEAVQNNCPSSRVPVYATVNQVPATPAVTTTNTCVGSKATLTTSSPAANILWYDDATNGNLLQTGNSYTTPSLGISTDFFAEALLNGCHSPRVAFPVTVNPTPAQPTAANATICSGNTAKLKATSAQGTIRWFAALTDTTGIANSDSLVTPVLQQQTVYYTATVLNGCLSARKTVTVTVNPTPDASFAINAADQCLHNNQFVLTNAQHQTGVQYSWNFGDSTSLNLANPVKTYDNTGSFAIRFKATSDKGCTAESQQNVTVSAPAVDFTFITNGSTVNFATGLSNIATYKWTFTSQDSASGANPVFTFPASGTYSVKLLVTDNNGCISTITKQVQVISTGTSELLAAVYHLNVFPNPVKEHVTVNYSLTQESDVQIALYDMQGKLLKEIQNGSQASGEQAIGVDLNEYTASVYLLKITINGQYQIIKLIAE